MVTTRHVRKLAYEDYLQFPEDGNRHEILDGDHCMSPPPTTRHQLVQMNLIRLLDSFAYANKLGWLLAAPTGVVLSPNDVVEPDLLFVSSPRRGIITRSHIQGAPDLAIEILSPSTRGRDLSLKMQRYEQLGVAEYWVVDPDENWLQAYRRNEPGEAFVAGPKLGAGDTLRTPLLPGLEIPVDAIFT